ncbi:MAG TPA: immunoglobulin domain-containing protein [Phycisphaerales bacterium]|nr:immunoglobulin domain-containing protein [Phycisphaerales bacterium]
MSMLARWLGVVGGERAALVAVFVFAGADAQGQFCVPSAHSASGGGVSAVSTVSSARVAIGHGSRVRLIDVSNPANPVAGGSVELSEWVRDMDSGVHTCVLGGSSFYIIDDNTLGAPSLLGGAFIGSGADAPLGIDTSGLIAYVVDRGGMSVYDISVPQVPSRLVKFESGPLGTMYDVCVTGSRAYAVSWENVNSTSFLLEFDVSTPSSPAITKSAFSATERFLAVTVSGQFAYVSSRNGLSVYDLAGSAPVLRSFAARSSSLSGEHVRLAVDGTKVYETCGELGVQVYDVADPSHAAPAWTVLGDGAGLDIAVDAANHRAYVASAEGGLGVLDSGSMNSPRIGGFTTTPSSVHSAALMENGVYAVLAMGDAGIAVVNASNPAAPAVVATLDIGLPVKDVAIAGSFAYLAAGSRVAMVNVQTPSNPQLRAMFGTGNEAYRFETIAAQGSNVFAPDRVDGRLRVLNGASGSSLSEMGSVALGGGGMPHDVLAGTNGRVYVALHTRLAIVDVVSPVNPQLRSSTAMNAPRALALSGVHVLVAGYPTLEIWNVANPVSPSRSSVLDGPAAGRGIWVQSSTATVLGEAGAAGLMMVDISQPGKPLLLNQSPGGVDPRGVVIGSSAMHIADGLGGYRIHRPFSFYPPVARVEAADVSAGRNCHVQFSVQVQAFPGPTFRWFRNGSELVDGVTAWGSHISGATTQAITIDGIGPLDAGSYTLGASNACGFSSVSTSELVYCGADFDCTGFVDTDDFTAFVQAFTEGRQDADFDGTGFVDTDDFTAFVLAFEAGC